MRLILIVLFCLVPVTDAQAGEDFHSTEDWGIGTQIAWGFSMGAYNNTLVTYPHDNNPAFGGEPTVWHQKEGDRRSFADGPFVYGLVWDYRWKYVRDDAAGELGAALSLPVSLDVGDELLYLRTGLCFTVIAGVFELSVTGQAGVFTQNSSAPDHPRPVPELGSNLIFTFRMELAVPITDGWRLTGGFMHWSNGRVTAEENPGIDFWYMGASFRP